MVYEKNQLLTVEITDMPSPFRIDAKCPFHRQCGGCQLQAMSYERQLQFKEAKVKNNLTRIGGFAPEFLDKVMDPIVGMENPFHYRNKALYPIGTGKDGKPKAGRKNSVFLPGQTGLVNSLSKVKGMASISVSISREHTNVVMGKEIHTIWGKESIQDTIYIRNVEGDFAATGQGITFSISPLSFYQVNPVQTEKLYSLALSYAGISGKETVWDLYCGIGTISLFLASNARQVYGVEIVPQAIDDAKQNAVQNDIKNAQFFVGSAEEIFPEKYAEDGMRADVVDVDPPRKDCLETILKMAPERIVYVSCDSATLARDLRILCEDAYEIKRVRAVDMFPMTVHTECVVGIQRKHI